MTKTERKNDRFLRYYDLPKSFKTLYDKSSRQESFNNLTRLLFSDNNIKYAIKRISSNPGRNTPGPDGLKFDNIMKYDHVDIIKNIKLRLTLKILPDGRLKEIPKNNGGYRTLGITNIFDRIAQQCVYNILESICEAQFLPENMGFRPNLSTQHTVAQTYNTIISSCIQRDESVFIIEGDINKCFDNIDLDKVLNILRDTFKIKDKRFLRIIKGIMWINYTGKKYNGIGLAQGSILGPILSNVLLHELDVYMKSISYGNATLNKNVRSKTRLWYRMGGSEKFYSMNKDNYSFRYYRYADDFVVSCGYQFIAGDLRDKIRYKLDELGLQLNMTKSTISEIGNNKGQLNFLGYKMKIKNGGIIISPKDIKTVKKKIKKNLFNYHYSIKRNNPKSKYNQLMSEIRGIFNYYGICTNLEPLIKYANNQLYKYSLINSKMTKVVGKDVYNIESKVPYINEYIDLWELRRDTNTSYSKFMKRNFWKCESEQEYFSYLSVLENSSEGRLSLYIRGLASKQQHLDPITNTHLSQYKLYHVHHITPRKLGGTDAFTNLLLISSISHKLIHMDHKLVLNYISQNRIQVDIKRLNTYRVKCNLPKV